MPHLYRHKHHGWEIRYNIYYLDGTFRSRVSKFAKKKTKALDIFGDAEKLETLSRRSSIHKDEAIYFRNLGLINDNDYHKIIGLPAPASLSWDTIKTLYLEHIKKVTRPGTYYIYNTMLPGILQFLSQYPTEKIDIELLKQYQTKRLEEVTKTTVNRYFKIIRALLDIAVEKRILTVNPARQMKYLPEGKDRMPRALYPHELKIFFKTLKLNNLCHGKLMEVALVSYYTGMRLGEIVNLLKENVRLKEGMIYVQAYGMGENYWRPKSSESVRAIDIHPDLLPIFKKLFKVDGQYLFSNKDGRPLKENSVSHAISKIIKRAKLPKDIGFHCLRHTFITNLLANGTPLKDAQMLAGHADIRTTMKYVHVIPKQYSPVKKLPSVI